MIFKITKIRGKYSEQEIKNLCKDDPAEASAGGTKQEQPSKKPTTNLDTEERLAA